MRAEDTIGKRYGKLVVLDISSNRTKQGKKKLICKCDCGEICEKSYINIKNGKTKTCGCCSKSEINDSDFIGKKFGEFTVLKFAYTNKKNVKKYTCVCSCGKIIDVNVYNLKNGKSTNCGCKRKEKNKKKLQKDIIGKKFGKLTVIRENGKTAYNKILYRCKCDCGGTCDVIAQNLLSGHTSSCGCIRSKNNVILEEAVNELGYDSIREYQININNNTVKYLRFDLFIPELNIAIEYDGECHFMEIDYAGKGKDWAREHLKIIKNRDKLKDIYCKENCIKLLRIPYWKKNKIKKIIKQFIANND